MYKGGLTTFDNTGHEKCNGGEIKEIPKIPAEHWGQGSSHLLKYEHKERSNLEDVIKFPL